jgi:hypothetical protein
LALVNTRGPRLHVKVGNGQLTHESGGASDLMTFRGLRNMSRQMRFEEEARLRAWTDLVELQALVAALDVLRLLRDMLL